MNQAIRTMQSLLLTRAERLCDELSDVLQQIERCSPSLDTRAARTMAGALRRSVKDIAMDAELGGGESHQDARDSVGRKATATGRATQ